jgi:hypothetical protein
MLVLALLVCACVFAAMTGPAVSLRTRTQALSQTLAAANSITKTVQVNAPWDEFTAYMNTGNTGYLGLGQAVNLTPVVAVAAGAACALVLPPLVGSALDLSVFTGPGVPVAVRPDWVSLGLPAAAALATEARRLSRRGVAGCCEPSDRLGARGDGAGGVADPVGP